ncbi:MAG: NUDIX hydrolase [Cytophagaceae bacterium]|nr:NUDIX hydrolase [Cytophagaceae bacterium]
MYTYEYPRPALTLDAVVFQVENSTTRVLLIQRKQDPWKGMWALPGGFLEMDETCEEGAKRELEEETGLRNVDLKQFYVFDGIYRDPRERIITVAHYGVLKTPQEIKGSDDASDARWFDIKNLPQLAGDHKLIVGMAIQKLKEEKK